eukprot:SAG22_NODE_1807_length_3531_cov_1.988636_2_plen_179_part_00
MSKVRRAPARGPAALLVLLLAALAMPAAGTFDEHTRLAVLCSYFDGHSPEQIVSGLGALSMRLMKPRTVRRWVATFEDTGSWIPARSRMPRFLMPSAHWQFVEEALQHDSTQYLEEIAGHVLVMAGVLYAKQQIAQTLARRGVTRKIADVRAMERDPIARTLFARDLNEYPRPLPLHR